MVLLVVVLAVVLLLVARQWKAVAPTALRIDGDNVTLAPQTHGEDAAGQALRQGGLPDLKQMRQATGGHAQEVQEAFVEVE